MLNHSEQLIRIPLLGEVTIKTLEKIGIKSLSDIASLNEKDCIIVANKLKFLSNRLAKNGYLRERLIMACRYAKAIKQNKPLFYGYNPLINSLVSRYREGKLVFFDLEYDIMKSFIFIIGTMDIKGRITQFFIENIEEEKEALRKLTNIISNKLLVCYAGKSADIPILRKCYRKYCYSMPNFKLIDLFYDVLFTQNLKTQVIYLPLTYLDEKTIANYLGYKSPAYLKIKDSLHALLYFHRYIGGRNRKIKREVKEQLLLYNRCDLERTKIILEKIFELLNVM